MHVSVACAPVFLCAPNRGGRTSFTSDEGIVAEFFLLREELPAGSCRSWDGDASGYTSGRVAPEGSLNHDASVMRRRERDCKIFTVGRFLKGPVYA
eukprot:3743694-Pleurochrysis_carterae.AAC.1